MLLMAKRTLSKTSGGVERVRGGVLALREVQESWGSLEELAAFVMLERRELVSADPEVVAAELGLSVASVRYLWFSSREFLALLDWHVMGGVWGVEARSRAMGVLASRVLDGSERLNDVVKAVEYLDGKVGVAPGRYGDGGGSGGSVVQIALVQEGDGSWSESHSPLRFGQRASSRAVAPSGKRVSAVEVLELDEGE